MNWFKIQSIEYGWWTAEIGGAYIECSDYLDYDMPKELLRKILRLLKGSSVEEWLYIMDEPGASMICIQLNYNKINFAEYDSLKTSYELNLHEKKENCGKCIYTTDVDVKNVVDGLVTEFSLYENGNGRALYENHWMKFPIDEYEELKLYAFELQKNAREYDELFCTTFLNN